MVENRRDCLRVTSSVRCSQRLLGVSLTRYRHKTRSSATCIRLSDNSPAPKIPEGADFVFGLSMFPVLRNKKKQKKNSAASATYDFISANTINRVYNIQSNAITTNSTIALIEFSPEGAPAWQDLQLYDQLSQVPFHNITRIVGPFAVGNNGESILVRTSFLLGFLFEHLTRNISGCRACICCRAYSFAVHYGGRGLDLWHGMIDRPMALMLLTNKITLHRRARCSVFPTPLW